MADACVRCGGAGWWWNGHERRACVKCNPPARQIPDPFRAKWVEYIPVADWERVKRTL